MNRMLFWYGVTVIALTIGAIVSVLMLEPLTAAQIVLYWGAQVFGATMAAVLWLNRDEL
jgi:hypothetical protein